mgnify:CR=1 FL=1
MQVLVVTSKYLPEYTGASYRIHNTYKRLREKNPSLNFTVICSSIEYTNSEQYEYEGINIIRIGAGKLSLNNNNAISPFFDVFVAYRQALLAYRYFDSSVDLVHVIGSSGLTAAAVMWAYFHDIPLVVELVTIGASVQYTLPGISYFWQPTCAGRVAIVAISEALAKKSEEQGFSRKIWSRPNPIDEMKFFPLFSSKHLLRKKLTKYSETDIVLVQVAKFMPQKNQLFLIEVLSKLPKRYKLVLAGPIVGDGALKKRDKNYIDKVSYEIKKYKLEDRVTVELNFVDTANYIRLADVYVLPSYSEGLGTPMLESIACGVPVVANSNEEAFNQWIRNGKNGFLVEMSADCWVKSVQKAILLNRDDLQFESDRIRKIAGTDIIDQGYFDLFNKLIETPAGENFTLS